jgi:hypothetical protein
VHDFAATTKPKRPVDSLSEESALPGMIWISGGEFLMGSDIHYAEEAPAHRVRVDAFWIDRTPVTNRARRWGLHKARTGLTVLARARALADSPSAPFGNSPPETALIAIRTRPPDSTE